MNTLAAITWDAIVVGGGPAGLSAALFLGRCRRNVLVFDHGRYRNETSHAMHGFVTREGIAPAEFRALARKDVLAFPDVELRETEAVDARADAGGVRVTEKGGVEYRARALILATGVIDSAPDLPGLKELFGKKVFVCPYCDAWEWKDKRLLAYGRGSGGASLALTLTRWSREVAACADASIEPADELEKARKRGVRVHAGKPCRVENGKTARLVFEDGSAAEFDALFLDAPKRLRSPLFERLGCRLDAKGEIAVDECQRTSNPRVFAAGDATRDVKMAVVAAAEGTTAAYALNADLMNEEFAC